MKSGSKDMSLWEHLEEFRWMLFKCLGVLVLCTFLGMAFTGIVYRALLYPVRNYLDQALLEEHFAGGTEGELSKAPSRTDVENRITDLLKLLEDKSLTVEQTMAAQSALIVLLHQRVDSLLAWEKGKTTGKRIRVVYSSPVEPFSVKIKVAFLGGIAFAVPFVCFFIWRFVSPGMGDSERRVVSRALGMALPLFLIGGAFGYCFLPFGIPALMKFSAAGVEQIWPLRGYIGFCVKLIIAFGLVFEMPLILGVLTRLSLVRVETLAKGRPYAVIIFFILAAILTPPDIYSQFALAIPMMLLYELSILVGKMQAGRGTVKYDMKKE